MKGHTNYAFFSNEVAATLPGIQEKSFAKRDVSNNIQKIQKISDESDDSEAVNNALLVGALHIPKEVVLKIPIENGVLKQNIPPAETLTKNDSEEVPQKDSIELPEHRFTCEMKEGPGGEKLNVLKTSEKKVKSTSLGHIRVKEKIKYDPKNKYEEDNETVKKYRSETLKKIVAPGSTIAYDLIIFIGLLRFSLHESINKIWEIIPSNYNLLHVPIGSISYISSKFLTYLLYIHETNFEKIKKIISKNGGYVLHIDGTREKGSEVLLNIKDAVSGINLFSRIISTEKSEYIIPILNVIKENFGIPLAIVRDNGSGIAKACAAVFPGVLQQICHFHFLRNLGKELFETIRKNIKKIFRKKGVRSDLLKMKRELLNEIKKIDNADKIVKKMLKNPELAEFDIDSFQPLITYAIVRWILDYEKDGEGYGFPFDQSYKNFYERCQEAKGIVEKYRVVNEDKNVCFEPLTKLDTIIQKLFDDSELSHELKKHHHDITEICELFDELRNILRIKPTEVPLSDDLRWDDDELNKMKEDVLKFKSRLEKKASELDKNSPLRKYIKKIVAYLDKYWDNLFVANFTITGENGEIKIIISRTNNLMEHLFRKIRQVLKKMTGKNKLSKMIRSHGMGLFILFNLENKEYVDAIFNGSVENMLAIFSKVDPGDFRKYQEKIRIIRKGNESITLKDKDVMTFVQNSIEKIEKLK